MKIDKPGHTCPIATHLSLSLTLNLCLSPSTKFIGIIRIYAYVFLYLYLFFRFSAFVFPRSYLCDLSKSLNSFILINVLHTNKQTYVYINLYMFLLFMYIYQVRLKLCHIMFVLLKKALLMPSEISLFPALSHSLPLPLKTYYNFPLCVAKLIFFRNNTNLETSWDTMAYT